MEISMSAENFNQEEIQAMILSYLMHVYQPVKHTIKIANEVFGRSHDSNSQDYRRILYALNALASKGKLYKLYFPECGALWYAKSRMKEPEAMAQK